jgi:hypothetical protein
MQPNESSETSASFLTPGGFFPSLPQHRTVSLVALVLSLAALASPVPVEQNWTNYVRIGAYGLGSNNADKIVADATASGVFGIEVDNDIEGRYESFLDPTEKLEAIQAVAKKAHAAGNYAFVYVAGTECITANADRTPHTLFKDHPDWVQRKITGEPALFGGGTAFWIRKGDEDVWVSPYAPEWRKIYMEHIRQIAATGIDGIYVDIPYWMTHFEGWEDTWASFDQYTVAAFKQQTGLDAKKDLKLGDFSDPSFRKWVDFRIQTFTDFMHEIDQNAKSVNPQIKTIPEIYPGIESESVRVGADVYSLYSVVDAIAHEYEFGEGSHLASERSPLNWFYYQVGMHSFRAFAQGKATWILNYSWDGNKVVDKREAMMNLAMSQVMAGANFWDAPGHSMAGSNAPPTRKRIFAWIKQNEKTFYLPRTPIHPIGVYFSPATRNYYAHDFIRSYRGILILLMQSHREFQIVTPRTLQEFRGETLILPDVRILTSDEQSWLEHYREQGKQLIITGNDPLQSDNQSNIVRWPADPGKAYVSSLEKDFDHSTPHLQQAFLDRLPSSPGVEISASPQVATSISRVNGEVHVFFANFAGLVAGKNPVQSPQSVTVTVPAASGTSAQFLPFLGEVQPLEGELKQGKVSFALPPIAKGAVFWLEAN